MSKAYTPEKGRWIRVLVHALYDGTVEGVPRLSQAEIGELFGWTRQYVSLLMKPTQTTEPTTNQEQPS